MKDFYHYPYIKKGCVNMMHPFFICFYYSPAYPFYIPFTLSISIWQTHTAMAASPLFQARKLNTLCEQAPEGW